MKFRLGKGQPSERYRPGQFVSKEYASQFADKVVPVARPVPLPAGPSPKVEYEVTATTRGGTPRKRPREGGRRVDQRVLQLKLRIEAPEGVIQSPVEAMHVIRDVVRGYGLPPEVTIRWIDWQKGTEGELVTEGRVPQAGVRQALTDFWGALTSGRAMVDMERA